MKFFIKFILILNFIPISQAVAGQLGERTIDRLSFQNHGGVESVWIYSTPSWDNPDSCAAANPAVLLKSDWMFTEKLSALLTAHASGSPVSIFALGCTTPDGTTSMPRIWGVTIK